MKKLLTSAAVLFALAVPAQAANTSYMGVSCTVSDPTGTPLNVRARPVNGPILGAFHNGTPVWVTDLFMDGHARLWTYVVPLVAGKRGWVFRHYLANCEGEGVAEMDSW
jgi:Bacterial SH3 domain